MFPILNIGLGTGKMSGKIFEGILCVSGTVVLVAFINVTEFNPHKSGKEVNKSVQFY